MGHLSGKASVSSLESLISIVQHYAVSLECLPCSEVCSFSVRSVQTLCFVDCSVALLTCQAFELFRPFWLYRLYKSSD